MSLTLEMGGLGNPKRADVRRVQTFVNDELLQKMKQRSSKQIRETASKAADIQMGRTFQWISNQILAGSNFGGNAFGKYRGSPWPQYSPSYKKKLARTGGSSRWFLYKNDSDDGLANAFLRVSTSELLNTLGNTKTQITQEGNVIRVIIAPNVRITRTRFEEQLDDLIDEDQLRKLRNRRNAYRSMVGPAFIYVARVLLPQAVRRALGAL